MIVTFCFDKQLKVRVENAKYCTFEFITHSFHAFSAMTKDMTLQEKKGFNVTFKNDENKTNG